MSEGDLGALRAACRQAAAAFSGRPEPRELQTAWALLKAADRCARDCRTHLGVERGMEANLGQLRLAVQTAQRMDLGPKLWEDPWLGQAREYLRAIRRRFQWDQAAEVGEAMSCQEKRREELRFWLNERRAPLQCGTGYFGPGATIDSCRDCGTDHAWFCHGCGLVQFNNARGLATKCLQGCDRAKFGWTCLGWKCEGSMCDCRHGDSYWRLHGSVSHRRDRTPSPERPDYSHLEVKTMEQLDDWCHDLGPQTWLKAEKPAQLTMDHLRKLCRQYKVSTEGTHKCLLNRLYWARDVRGKIDYTVQSKVDGSQTSVKHRSLGSLERVLSKEQIQAAADSIGFQSTVANDVSGPNDKIQLARE